MQLLNNQRAGSGYEYSFLKLSNLESTPPGWYASESFAGFMPNSWGSYTLGLTADSAYMCTGSVSMHPYVSSPASAASFSSSALGLAPTNISLRHIHIYGTHCSANLYLLHRYMLRRRLLQPPEYLMLQNSKRKEQHQAGVHLYFSSSGAAGPSFFLTLSQYISRTIAFYFIYLFIFGELR